MVCATSSCCAELETDAKPPWPTSRTPRSRVARGLALPWLDGAIASRACSNASICGPLCAACCRAASLDARDTRADALHRAERLTHRDRLYERRPDDRRASAGGLRLRQSPAIAGGRVPLTLQLLSPAQRPVQVTRDLASFWRSGYAEVRKELKGRYPKHYWPEDPHRAEARRAGFDRGDPAPGPLRRSEVGVSVAESTAQESPSSDGAIDRQPGRDIPAVRRNASPPSTHSNRS